MQHPTSYSRAEHEQMIEAAKAHARMLREQALQEAFDAALGSASRAARAANRLAHRLARHAALRGRGPAHGQG